MNNILLLGVGIDQIPMIDRAHMLGWKVIGFDGNPEAGGASSCDYFEWVDIRDPDKVWEIAEDFNKRRGIDAVMAPATEMGISCGRIVDKLGLKGIGEKTARELTDKVERRLLLDDLKINQPKWDNSAEAWSTFPCIIKPRNQMAAVGVKVCHNSYELLAMENCDIIEEYLEGWELSTEVLCFNRGLFMSTTADRNYYAPVDPV